MDGIAKARSLGLLDAITASYSIPIMYAQAEIDVNYVKTLIGQIHEYDATDMKYQYGSYRPKNKKVFALYNIYEIRAAVGGEVGAFEGRELYSGGQYPGFWIYADPSPEGRPYCQPIWYKGNRTISFQNSISGAQWSTDPYLVQNRVFLMRLHITAVLRPSASEGQSHGGCARFWRWRGVRECLAVSSQYSKWDWKKRCIYVGPIFRWHGWSFARTKRSYFWIDNRWRTRSRCCRAAISLRRQSCFRFPDQPKHSCP